MLVVWLLALNVKAQLRVSDTTVSTFMFKASYALQIPGGDHTAYFGMNSTIGAGVAYKTDKNWLHTVNGHFIFGDKVNNRSELLKMITTSTGELIDGDGTFASIALFQRGYHFNYQAGKIFNVFAPNPNSGILLQAGAGYLAHYIVIESQFGTAPQIDGDYAKGYDKMRGGFALSGEAGYMLMSNSRVLNFSLSIEYVHAFTRSMRDYSFDTMLKDDNNYTDSYLGFRLSWMIPTYRRAPDKYYYF
jgi:hypothetical protein